MRVRWFTLLLALLLVAVITLSISIFLIGDGTSDSGTVSTPYPSPPEDAPEEIKAIWEVWSVLVNEHVVRGDLDLQELKEAAIQGMLDLVDDPYTSYLNPDIFRLESGSFSGSFEGIGAEVTLRRGLPVIVSPLPNTPAEQAGVRPGDVILAVDGVSTEGKSLQDAILRIRGPRGTSVTLTVRHFGQSELVDITIVRGEITIESVYTNIMDDNIGYVNLRAFNENTDRVLLVGLEAMKEQGVTGIVLDLRNNPGGLVSSTVDVASHFLIEGLVLYEVNGRGERTNLEVRGDPLFPDIPLVVLVNRFSASGSEVLAGALQDHDRAQLVGTRTFGKGAVNLLRRLSDGGGLNFTFANWFTPDGRLIEGDGLEPDFVVPGNPGPEGDPQLDKAVELIKGHVAASSQ